MKDDIILIVLGLFIGYELLTGEDSNDNSSSSDNNSSTGSSSTSNLSAFLKTIQYAEGTFYESNPYAVTYGYDHIIRNFSDHPAITGEWRGKVLPDSFCTNVGLSTGCKSTAAGAYQIIKPTWESIKRRKGNIGFDAYGQDIGAIELIRQRGALADVENGRFQIAINKLNKEWASLPNSPYGQPTRGMVKLENFYISQGGNFG